VTAARRLSENALPELHALLKLLELDTTFSGEATITGDDPVIRSPHRLGTASATTLLAGGAAAAVIWQARTGQTTDIGIDIGVALNHLHPTHFIAQMGYPSNVGAEFVPANGFFPTRDGQYVMIMAGPPYAKLLDGYLNFFDCANNRETFASRIATWDAEPLETALSEAGLPACRAFTYEQWCAHPQGQLLASTPPIDIVKIADGDPVPFTAGATSPLEGVRVLDFTHVLAGPRSAQTLAEFGADVLHISSPSHPDTLPQHFCVDFGKRCAYLELTKPEDAATLRGLLATSDVLTSTYRLPVNRRWGLTPEELAGNSERGIVCMTANAYGYDGPWADRPGFDQNGQVASGFAMREGGDKPKFSPVFYVADLITGYLASVGIMAALLRRATEGGSYHVRVSLARSAMWVQELGLIDAETAQQAPATDIHLAHTVDSPTPYGAVTRLGRALDFTNLALPDITRLVPYGADEPAWW
jgi:crotonobetainyl-CoA:carnitine CoA-transferase CaiB-like acyl-CoA transferase